MTRAKLLALAAVAGLASALALWPEPGKVRLVTVAICAEGDDYRPDGGDPARCRTAACVLRREPTRDVPDLRGEARLSEDLGLFTAPDPPGPPLQCWRPKDAPAPVRTALRNAYRSVCRNTVDAGLCRVPGGDGGTGLVPAPYERTLPRAGAVGAGCVPMPSELAQEVAEAWPLPNGKPDLAFALPEECRR